MSEDTASRDKSSHCQVIESVHCLQVPSLAKHGLNNSGEMHTKANRRSTYYIHKTWNENPGNYIHVYSLHKAADQILVHVCY